MNELCNIITIRQQDIQKRGGKAARYPSSYIVKMLLQQLFPSLNIKVCDVTYGEGRFYALFAHRLKLLVANDIRRLRWIVKPDVFFKGPSWKLLDKLLQHQLTDFDVVVVDPPFSPYARGLEKRYWYLPSNAKGTPIRIINDAIYIAQKLSVPYVLIHYRFLKDFGHDVVAAVEFRGLWRYSKPTYSYYYIIKL